MLRKKTFQNKVAASRYSLPITAILATVAWVAVGFMSHNIWAEFAFTIISTLLMVQLNNQNSLMRTYSRMVSCSFLVLITMASLPTPSFRASIVTMCFIAFYLIVWNTYQDRQASGWTFYAFFCIGLASTIFIQVLYFMPLCWLMMLVFTNSFSLRTFVASLIGIVTPYWFMVIYYAIEQDIDGLLTHLMGFIDYQELFDYSGITIHQIVNILYILILGIIGSVHFLHTSYADKIRTRMIYESLIMMNFVTFAFLILQPQHQDELTGIMIVNTAPLIAHYITFTRGKASNISFIAMIVLVLVLLLYNVLVPETTILQEIQQS